MRILLVRLVRIAIRGIEVVPAILLAVVRLVLELVLPVRGEALDAVLRLHGVLLMRKAATFAVRFHCAASRQRDKSELAPQTCRPKQNGAGVIPLRPRHLRLAKGYRISLTCLAYFLTSSSLSTLLTLSTARASSSAVDFASEDVDEARQLHLAFTRLDVHLVRLGARIAGESGLHLRGDGAVVDDFFTRATGRLDRQVVVNRGHALGALRNFRSARPCSPPCRRSRSAERCP